LTSQSKTSRLDFNACACTARVLKRAACCLLILSALSLLSMPITEYCWTWDRFLQTGRDFELGTLLVLMLLCLVLVLSKQRKQCIESFLSLSHILAFRFADTNEPVNCLSVEVSVFNREQGSDTRAGMCGSPLQI